MANVKISELPTLGELAGDDYIIVNDTSSNTTCKMQTANLRRVFTGTLPLNDNLSANTANGRISYTLDYVSPFFAYLEVNFNGVVITNNSADNVAFGVKCVNIASSLISTANMTNVIPNTTGTQLSDVGHCIAYAGNGYIFVAFKGAFKNASTGVISNSTIQAIVPANSSHTCGTYDNIRLLVKTYNAYSDISAG